MLSSKRILDREYIELLTASILYFSSKDNPPIEYLKFMKFMNKTLIYQDLNQYYKTANKDWINILSNVIDYIDKNGTLSADALINLKQYLKQKYHEEYNFGDTNIIFEQEIDSFIEKIFEISANIDGYSIIELRNILEKEYLYLTNKHIVNIIKTTEDYISSEDIKLQNFIQKKIYEAMDCLYTDALPVDEELSISINVIANNSEFFNNLKTVENEKRIIQIFKDYDIIETRRLLICMAPTGFGKSQFLCHVAADYLTNASFDKEGYFKDNVIFYFSFENTKTETMYRIFSNITNMRIKDIHACIKNQDNFWLEKVKNILVSKIKPYNHLEILEIPPAFGRVNTRIIEEKIKNIMRKKYPNGRIYAIIIDYLDLMNASSKRAAQRWEELGEISRELKALAMEFDTPVITATQTNRQGEEEVQKKQELSRTQVSEGYSKLKDADIVLGLVVKRIEDTSPESDYIDHYGKFIIMKHRYGQSNKVIPVLADYRRAKFFNTTVDTSEIQDLLLYIPEHKSENFFDENYTREELFQNSKISEILAAADDDLIDLS